jgi:hypothetical protein
LLHVSNFKENRQVGAALTRADRRTDVTKVTDAFCDSVKGLEENISTLVRPDERADTYAVS